MQHGQRSKTHEKNEGKVSVSGKEMMEMKISKIMTKIPCASYQTKLRIIHSAHLKPTLQTSYSL